MSKHEYYERIYFKLPDFFRFEMNEVKKGWDYATITFFDTAEMKQTYCSDVYYNLHGPREAEEELTSETLLDYLAEKLDTHGRMDLPGRPSTTILSLGSSVTCLGTMIKSITLVALVQVRKWSVLKILTTHAMIDYKPEDCEKLSKYVHSLLKAVRIRFEKLPFGSKKLPMRRTSAAKIQDFIERSLEAVEEDIDISSDVISGLDDEDREIAGELFADYL